LTIDGKNFRGAGKAKRSSEIATGWRQQWQSLVDRFRPQQSDEAGTSLVRENVSTAERSVREPRPIVRYHRARLNLKDRALAALRETPTPAAILAERMEAHLVQVYDTMHALRKEGIPIQWLPGGKGYALVEEARLDAIARRAELRARSYSVEENSSP
jgi:hypothetical protein